MTGGGFWRTCSTVPAGGPRTYHHSWRPGDVVIWDNRRMLHRATSWDLAERRVLRHVRVGGDRPGAWSAA